MGAIGAIMKYDSEPQKRLAAALVLAGDKPAICITEPEAGSAASEMTTRADRRGNGFAINGRNIGSPVAVFRASILFWRASSTSTAKRKGLVIIGFSGRCSLCPAGQATCIGPRRKVIFRRLPSCSLSRVERAERPVDTID